MFLVGGAVQSFLKVLPPRLCGLRSAPLTPVCHQLISDAMKSQASHLSIISVTDGSGDELVAARHGQK